VTRRGRALATLLAVSGLVGCSVLVGCSPDPPTDKPVDKAPANFATVAPDYQERSSDGTSTPNTVRVDLARSLGRFPFAPGRQLSAVPKSWQFGPKTEANLDRLGLERIRVWLKFTDLYDVGNRIPWYENAYEYLDTYSSRTDSLILNWQTGYDPVVTSHKLTERELEAAEIGALTDLKRRYPKITYLEVENEPTSLDRYYPAYRLAYRVVNAVNALGLPGGRLQVGGPALDTFSEQRLNRFFSLYASDPDPHKRLDFVSYHQYLISTDGSWHEKKDDPAMVASERHRLDVMLADHGLPSVPAIVSETGTFPADRASSLSHSQNLHVQAAGVAAIHYYYAGQRGIVPLNWTIDHPENDLKDLFLDVKSGIPRPAYNAMLMESMLPQTRFAATSDRLSAEGLGVYALAGASDRQVAVMTWNYQWTHQRGYDSRIVLNHLPAPFQRGRIRVEQYTIPADEDSGPMPKVADFEVSGADSYRSQRQRLLPNELRLIVLTAVG
jgi:hypothetical protein